MDFINVLLHHSKQNRFKIGITAAVVYVALVRYFRYRQINKLKRKYPDPTIALYDHAVAEEVFNNTNGKEFPCKTSHHHFFLSEVYIFVEHVTLAYFSVFIPSLQSIVLARTSLELALFKTYAVPSISKILHATGAFSKQTLKRAEDTGLILVNLFFLCL